MSSSFGAIAKDWSVKTVSVYACDEKTRSYSLGDAVFPVEHGTVLMPDTLARQLELTRIGRHEHVEAFRITETGDVEIVFYPGKDPKPEPVRCDPMADGSETDPPTDAERGELSEQTEQAIADAIAQHEQTETASAAATVEPTQPTAATAGDVKSSKGGRKRGT